MQIDRRYISPYRRSKAMKLLIKLVIFTLLKVEFTCVFGLKYGVRGQGSSSKKMDQK